MIEELKTRRRGPLPATELHRLGQVNVICGRNNSGKSTLLSAICAEPSPLRGLTFKDEAADPLYRVFNAASEAARQMGQVGERQMIDVVEKVVGQRESRVWFEDEANVLVAKWEDELKSVMVGRYHRNPHYVVGQYPILFPELSRRILIPAKRVFGTDTDINALHPVQETGVGILNRLFLWNNQAPGSVERQRYDEIQRAFQRISEGHDFYIAQDPATNQLRLQFSRDNKLWLNAEDCGLGLQDLLTILYFAIEPEYGIVGIEEPENHLHPRMQRLLLTYLRGNTNKQYFLTTHSTVFLTPSLVDRVFFTEFDGEVHVSDETRRAQMLSDLGYSATDNLAPDLVLLLEGPNDTPVFETLLTRVGLLPKFDIKMWPLGGDVMAKCDLTAFAAQDRIIAVIDNDPKSGSIRDTFVKNCEAAKIPVHRLKRYSIENYFPIDAYREVFGPQVPERIQEIKPDQKVEDQIKFDPKRNNRALADATPTAYWLGTDLKEVVSMVETRCKS